MSTSALNNPNIPSPKRPTPDAPVNDGGFHVLMLDTDGGYAVDRKNFLYSYAINMATVALLILASHWTFTHKELIKKQVSTIATSCRLPEVRCRK
jgi:hypothetical protein